MTIFRNIKRWQVWSTIGIVLLGLVGTLAGLFLEGFYKDPAALRLQATGQDMVTLAVVLPALAVSLWFARRGSATGYLLWLGSLGYLAYTYLVYAVITEFNWFFLGYVALFGLSTYTFTAGLLRTDADAVKARLSPQLPTRLVSVFFAAMGVLVGLLWLAEAVPATITNTKPASVGTVGLPANVVHVLDLGLVIPAVLLTALWLRQGKPWGFVLTGVLFVKVVSISLAVLAMIARMAAAGEPVAMAEVAVFGLLTVVGVAVTVVYFRSLSAADAGDDADERPPAASG